ncbi:MAG: DNA-processing protein DprA [Actinomycetota bacterium]
MTGRAPLSDDHAAAVALAGLESLGVRRLRVLVDHFGTPSRALRALQHGRARAVLTPTFGPKHRHLAEPLCARWAAEVDAATARALLETRAAHVWLERDLTYPVPEPLPDAPVCLIAEGERPDALDAPRVAIVGTRSATPHGLADARELAGTLVDAGVTVVSGLALGIDGAAHAGAVAAGGSTVGVVATGLDVEYPRRHRGLYGDVRASGLVLGETGYCVRPAPWRFPIRNRIIAALADVVVVVEATLTGGARITAEHAVRYDRAVFAVPGSRRNTASAGTNALIADGAYPLTDWSDVLVALGMTPGARRCAPPVRAVPDEAGHRLLGALGGEPASPEQLAARTGLAPEVVALSVAALERTGWVTWSQGLVWPQ